MTKLIALFALLACGMWAQPQLTVSAPPGYSPKTPPKDGTTLVLGLTISGTASAGVSAIQFQVPALTVAWNPVCAVTTAYASTKQIQCSLASGTLAGEIVPAFPVSPPTNSGFSLTDGLIATVTIKIPKSLPTGSTPMSLTGILACNGQTTLVPVTAGAAFWLKNKKPFL